MRDNNPYASPKTIAGSDGESCLRVTRTTSFADRIRAYRVLVDGREVATISAGQTIDVPIASGAHTIVAKIDWCGSPTRQFNIDSGQTVHFECGSNLRGMRIFLAFVYVLFLRNEYLTLEQA